jgi:hypothetical protein
MSLHFNQSPATMSSKPKRSIFNETEDQKLTQLVYIFGFQNWEMISNFLPGKNSRQCMDRWKGYLSPWISNHPWSNEEDQFLLQMVAEMGKKWVKLTSFFPYRSDIALKNRFQLLMRRQSKEFNQNNGT